MKYDCSERCDKCKFGNFGVDEEPCFGCVNANKFISKNTQLEEMIEEIAHIIKACGFNEVESAERILASRFIQKIRKQAVRDFIKRKNELDKAHSDAISELFNEYMGE